MGLETGDRISDLNASWPLGSDPKSQGDDHIRLTKAVMKNDIVPRTTGGDFHASIGVESAGNPRLTLNNTGDGTGPWWWQANSNGSAQIDYGGATKYRFEGPQTTAFTTTSVITREAGDARYTQSVAMKALLALMEGKGLIKPGDRAGIEQLMEVEGAAEEP